MSPDKVHTVSLIAMQMYAHVQSRPDFMVGTEVYDFADAVGDALALYDETSRQVRASGPTSTEKLCTCHRGYPNGGAPLNRPVDCAKHG